MLESVTQLALGFLVVGLAFPLLLLFGAAVAYIAGRIFPCAHRHVVPFRREDDSIGLRCVVCGAWRDKE